MKYLIACLITLFPNTVTATSPSEIVAWHLKGVSDDEIISRFTDDYFWEATDFISLSKAGVAESTIRRVAERTGLATKPVPPVSESDGGLQAPSETLPPSPKPTVPKRLSHSTLEAILGVQAATKGGEASFYGGLALTLNADTVFAGMDLSLTDYGALWANLNLGSGYRGKVTDIRALLKFGIMSSGGHSTPLVGVGIQAVSGRHSTWGIEMSLASLTEVGVWLASFNFRIGSRL